MNILLHIAQATETLTPYIEGGISETEAVAAGVTALAILSTFLIAGLFLGLIAYVLSSLFLMRIFNKAGVPGWSAWVPVYNNWKLLEIGGQQGFWAILSFVPVVNIVSIVMIYIAQYHIGLKLGKSGAFVALAILLPPVWLIWLAVDKSTWNDTASSAPSLHTNPNTQNTPAQPNETPIATAPQQFGVQPPAPVTPTAPVVAEAEAAPATEPSFNQPAPQQSESVAFNPASEAPAPGEAPIFTQEAPEATDPQEAKVPAPEQAPEQNQQQ